MSWRGVPGGVVVGPAGQQARDRRTFTPLGGNSPGQYRTPRSGVEPRQLRTVVWLPYWCAIVPPRYGRHHRCPLEAPFARRSTACDAPAWTMMGWSRHRLLDERG